MKRELSSHFILHHYASMTLAWDPAEMAMWNQ